MKTPQICGALALLTLPLAAQVSFTGSYTQNFDSIGTDTAPPAGWSHIGALTGSNSSWSSTTPTPASGTISAASAGAVNSTLIVNSNAGAATATSNSQAFNFALSTSTTDRSIGTSPTSGAGNILQLRLTNHSGAALTAFRIGYDIRRFITVSPAEDLPGYRLFISSDGGTSWTNVTVLNPVLTGGTVNVPTTSGVTSVALTVVNLPSSVAIGSEVRFRWVDDNGPPSPDQIMALDNVLVSLPVSNVAPTVSLTAPAINATYDAPATVNLTADAADSDGTVSKVEFFRGAVKLGEDTTAPYEFAWTNALTGTYVLTALATDSLLSTATSSAVNITVTNTDNIAPTVALTAPANGTTILTTSTTLTATAADSDGLVSKVEFFNGASKLGEDTTSPYSYDWTGLTTGNYTLTAVATDNDNVSTTSSAVSISAGVPITTNLIARRASGQPGQVWKYLDNGTNQGSAWKESAFNDSAWASGAAPLGYGDSHIVTTVFSPAAPNRYITTYFRRGFNVIGAAAIQALNLNILRDDGVVVYINGTEVARQNMPAGTINHLTSSSTIADGANETTYFASTASPMPVLLEGANTIAVELHQRDGNSSDLGFDLELISLMPPGTPPVVSITAPANNASFAAPAAFTVTADATDADGTITKVEFWDTGSKLGEDTTAPYTLDVSGLAQGIYTYRAIATDNFAQTTSSAPISVTVTPPDTLLPTVTLTAPADNATYLAPATIGLSATATDSDGTVSKVEFFNGAVKLGEDSTAPYTFTWANVPLGTYVVTARATDNLTAVGVSTSITVNVQPNLPPTINLTSPANLASVPAPSANLQVAVADPENLPQTVTFYGREKGPTAGADFTLVTIPDTQFYSENINNRFQYFTSQTNWIVASKAALSTKFVAHMGDMTQSYNALEAEFVRADEAMDLIENPLTTLLQHGIPWGGAPGNHDIGSGGNTSFWNQYFGLSRWAGRPYFGGGYASKSDNNWQIFNGGGMDFIVVNLAYNSSTSGNQAIMDWADALLKAYPNHRAIITSHWLIGTGNPAAWGGHGQAVYDNLKDNPNLFLMLCGHIHGEGQRSDSFEGRTVHTVLQDYQSRSNGGDSWLRYFTFKPSENKIDAFTYKTNTAPNGNPMGGTLETDADSQFSLPYNMQSAAPWIELGTVNVDAGGTSASVNWTGLIAGKEYEWYAAVSDGVTPVSSGVRSFTATVPLPVVTIAATDATAGEFGADQALGFTITRTGSTVGALTVPLTASGSASSPLDYSGFASSVIIPAALATVALPLTVLPDTDSEGVETVTITLAASPDFITGSPAFADANIADSPAQGFFFTNIADPAKRAATVDADGDESANIVEYFMGTLPGDSNSKGVLEIPSTGSNTFKIRYPRAKNRPAVSANLLWTSNLENWNTSGESDGAHTVSFTETIVSDPAADPETIEATATITGAGEAPKIFVRLGVR